MPEAIDYRSPLTKALQQGKFSKIAGQLEDDISDIRERRRLEEENKKKARLAEIERARKYAREDEELSAKRQKRSREQIKFEQEQADRKRLLEIIENTPDAMNTLYNQAMDSYGKELQAYGVVLPNPKHYPITGDKDLDKKTKYVYSQDVAAALKSLKSKITQQGQFEEIKGSHQQALQADAPRAALAISTKKAPTKETRDLISMFPAESSSAKERRAEMSAGLRVQQQRPSQAVREITAAESLTEKEQNRVKIQQKIIDELKEELREVIYESQDLRLRFDKKNPDPFITQQIGELATKSSTLRKTISEEEKKLKDLIKELSADQKVAEELAKEYRGTTFGSAYQKGLEAKKKPVKKDLSGLDKYKITR